MKSYIQPIISRARRLFYQSPPAPAFPSSGLRAIQVLVGETVVFSGSAIDFGTLAVDTPQTVAMTIRNSGPVQINVIALSLYGPDFAFFELEEGASGPRSLDPGEEFDFDATFLGGPDLRGYLATLVIQHNVGDGLNVYDLEATVD